MKRRNFLKGILSTPVAAIGISKAVTDLSILNVPSCSPKPLEVEECEVETEGLPDDFSGTFSCSISASPSASCDDVPWIDDIDSKYL